MPARPVPPPGALRERVRPMHASVRRACPWCCRRAVCGTGRRRSPPWRRTRGTQRRCRATSGCSGTCPGCPCSTASGPPPPWRFSRYGCRDAAGRLRGGSGTSGSRGLPRELAHATTPPPGHPHGDRPADHQRLPGLPVPTHACGGAGPAQRPGPGEGVGRGPAPGGRGGGGVAQPPGPGWGMGGAAGAQPASQGSSAQSRCQGCEGSGVFAARAAVVLIEAWPCPFVPRPMMPGPCRWGLPAHPPQPPPREHLLREGGRGAGPAHLCSSVFLFPAGRVVAQGTGVSSSPALSGGPSPDLSVLSAHSGSDLRRLPWARCSVE